MPGAPDIQGNFRAVFTPLSSGELTAIRSRLSAERFSTYLRLAGYDPRKALKLYKWNADLAQAFHWPLHILEIATRNTVASILELKYGPQWPQEAAFAASLDSDNRGKFNRELTRQITRMGPANFRPAELVAKMTFGFWIALLDLRQNTALWLPYLTTAFPNLPTSGDRQLVHGNIDALRQLRNRIAHHEPILTRNLTFDYVLMKRTIGWICRDTAKWVDERSTCLTVISMRP